MLILIIIVVIIILIIVPVLLDILREKPEDPRFCEIESDCHLVEGCCGNIHCLNVAYSSPPGENCDGVACTRPDCSFGEECKVVSELTKQNTFCECAGNEYNPRIACNSRRDWEGICEGMCDYFKTKDCEVEEDSWGWDRYCLDYSCECFEEDCANEGETISGQLGSTEKCCEGLVATTDTPDLAICIKCGDGICKAYENVYDCPEDCEDNKTIEERYNDLADSCTIAGVGYDACIQSDPVYQEYKAWCESQGGSFGYIGLSLKEYCNLPTSDGGTECRDSSECEGSCLVELTPEQDRIITWDHQVIMNITGTCTSYHMVVGCIAEVLDGKVEFVVCYD